MILLTDSQVSMPTVQQPTYFVQKYAFFAFVLVTVLIITLLILFILKKKKSSEHLCPNCGNPIKSGKNFCKNCGAKIK